VGSGEERGPQRGGRRLAVIVAEGCPACEAIKGALSEIKDVEVLDVTKSLEAARILRDLGIFKVPLFVAIGEGEVCAFDDEKGEVKCVKSVPSEEELKEKA